MAQVECWNAFCISGVHLDDDHVDATGDTWTQRPGTEYNPETGDYDEEGAAMAPGVVTLHRADPYGRQLLEVGELYPVASEDSTHVPSDWERRAARVRATGEKRRPRAGEWFLSGATIEGYKAHVNLSTEYHIGELVRGETMTVWREVK